MTQANEKVTCECGGKYTKTNKVKHVVTKKHLKYLDSIKSKEPVDERPVCTMTEIEADVELGFAYDTITRDDPEHMLLKAHTVKEQIKILNKFGRGQIPAHLSNRAKSEYFYHVLELYDQIKGGTPYVYTPPDRDLIREETIRSYQNNGYRIEE
jgi:hypothetical protein